MSFETRHLTVLSYWAGRTLWHYRAGRAVPLDDVCAPGFFDRAASMVREGDTVWITGSDGSRTMVVTEAGPDTVLLRPTAPAAPGHVVLAP